MQLFIDHYIIVETTGVYTSPINGKVERPRQIINNMVRIQLLSWGHSNELWCFCYKYTILIISQFIEKRLGTDPIVDW